MNLQPNTESGPSAEYTGTPEEQRVDAGRGGLLRRNILPTVVLARQSIEAARLGTLAGVPRPDEARLDR